jgi:AraC-like DNA-binding protein
VTGEERVAVACALARAAAQFQEAALVEHWLAEGTIGPHGGMVSYGYFYRLAELTGLSEKALQRRFRKAVHDTRTGTPEGES